MTSLLGKHDVTGHEIEIVFFKIIEEMLISTLLRFSQKTIHLTIKEMPLLAITSL
jgi:hypothetical protein|nr:MAG TPA: hypothetical protein [Caudoviricetes sp.]